jgi:hypothetical protein
LPSARPISSLNAVRNANTLDGDANIDAGNANTLDRDANTLDGDANIDDGNANTLDGDANIGDGDATAPVWYCDVWGSREAKYM